MKEEKSLNEVDTYKKKYQELLGNDLGEMIFKIASQLAKVDELEKEINKIKERLDN